jgi:membrane protease YdiL (CAAX protease family)
MRPRRTPSSYRCSGPASGARVGSPRRPSAGAGSEVTAHRPDPAPTGVPSVRWPRWGIWDAVVGFVAAQALSTAVGVVVIGALVGEAVATGTALASALDDQARSPSAGVALGALLLLQLPLWATQLGTVVWAGQVRGSGVRRDFGLAVRPVDVPVGLAGGVAAQIAVSTAYALVSQVADIEPDQTARQISAKGSGLAVLALVVLFGLVAPVVEELFYRGLLLRSLERSMSGGAALVVSALVFAAIHFELLLLPGLFLAGLIFGWLVQRSGRLGPGIFAHIGFNSLTIVTMALSNP